MSKTINIISWNVNGLRACHRKGCFKEIMNTAPDILCLQETKSLPEQLPEEVRKPEGYYSFFDYSKGRKGYSGVAIYSKEKPESVKEGMESKEFDQEGRLIAAYYKDFVLLNVYFPNGGGGAIRLKYKLEFYEVFLKFIEKLRKKYKNIIFCGDINTAHKETDLARPKENAKNTGFLPEERAWIDKVVGKNYIDVFRHYFPNLKDAYTYWDMKTFARERNVGWRIDYFFVSKELIPNLVLNEILSKIYGSDHCPISLKFKI